MSNPAFTALLVYSQRINHISHTGEPLEDRQAIESLGTILEGDFSDYQKVRARKALDAIHLLYETLVDISDIIDDLVDDDPEAAELMAA